MCYSSIKNLFRDTIQRVEKIPSSLEVGKFGRNDLLPFNKGKSGLASINMENLQDLNPLTNKIVVDILDCMWIYEKSRYRDKIPGLFHYIIHLKNFQINTLKFAYINISRRMEWLL